VIRESRGIAGAAGCNGRRKGCSSAAEKAIVCGLLRVRGTLQVPGFEDVKRAIRP
jgi:hypothetical protein